MTPEIEEFRTVCRAALTVRFPTEEAIRGVVERQRKAYEVSKEEAEECVAWLEASLGVSMSLGSVLQEDDFEPWLSAARARIDWYYWKRYREMLDYGEHMPPLVVNTMDQVTDKILDHCGDPLKEGSWDRRGMVLGHVQSGKTANYTGLICKAADAGFRLIIVIAGIHNRLRNQTQERIDAGFVGVDSSRIFAKDPTQRFVGVGKLNNRRRPTSFTSSSRDFNRTQASSLGMSIENSNEPVVFVIKKNHAVLRNLLEWLREHNTAVENQTIGGPMLLIDDEADNASINIAHGRDEVSKINGQIRDLLRLFDRSAYVGYTATPFANIFIDPDTDDEMVGSDLFPRDFIVSLDPPSNYFGPNAIFIDNPDKYLVTIEDCEEYLPASHRIDFELGLLAPSLLEAVRSFVIARAIRILRGQQNEHMSMLVNASRFTGIQGLLRSRIYLALRDLESEIRIESAKPPGQALKNPALAAIHKAWIDKGFNGTEFSWKEIQGALLDSAAAIQVVAINSSSADPLDYEGNAGSGLSVIAVGGLALSRGITLEGLMISYFYRRSLMYDTLMQMGRWFGYRDGYDDLCRVWMSEEAQGWYEHITESVDLLRQELKIMEAAGAAPKDFGLKIRSHPDALLITARNKVGAGEMVPVEVGLGNSMIETATLDATESAIEQNRLAAIQLADRLRDQGFMGEHLERVGSGYLVENVTPEPVLRFLAEFRNHDASHLTNTRPVRDYIESRSGSTLQNWDILFVSRSDEKGQKYSDLGMEIYPQIRTAGKSSTEATIRVTDKQRVASRGIEKVGVSSELVEAVESEFRAVREEDGLPMKNSNYPDRIYRSVRERPLLLVHSLAIKAPGDGNAPGLIEPTRPVIAWGISFPRPPRDVQEKKVVYMVNTNWLREHAMADFDRDEVAGDDE